MANLDKLGSHRATAGNSKTRIEPSTRAAEKSKTVAVRLTPETHKRLRLHSFEADESIQMIVEQLIEDYLDEKDA